MSKKNKQASKPATPAKTLAPAPAPAPQAEATSTDNASGTVLELAAAGSTDSAADSADGPRAGAGTMAEAPSSPVEPEPSQDQTAPEAPEVPEVESLRERVNNLLGEREAHFMEIGRLRKVLERYQRTVDAAVIAPDATVAQAPAPDAADPGAELRPTLAAALGPAAELEAYERTLESLGRAIQVETEVARRNADASDKLLGEYRSQRKQLLERVQILRRKVGGDVLTSRRDRLQQIMTETGANADLAAIRAGVPRSTIERILSADVGLVKQVSEELFRDICERLMPVQPDAAA